MDKTIEELEYESYSIKVLVNSSIYPLSNEEYTDLVNKRMEIKSEIRRLKTVKERRGKIMKIRNK